MRSALVAAIVLLGIGIAVAPSGAAPRPANVATPIPLPSPELLLYQIRRQFRSHRPPPPYVTYTLIRKQTLDDGYPDLLDSYTYHIWCRTYDRAALGRRVYRGSSRGTLEFLRPSFNEPWDPGPPTADLFEPAPAHPHNNPREFVPTPEPSASLPPVIATVTALGEFDYRVTRVADEGDLIHVSLVRDAIPTATACASSTSITRRSRRRKSSRPTSSTKRTAARKVYPRLFTVTLGWMNNMPIVTHIHGTPTYQADADYLGRDATVDYDFNDITFPPSLPDWYFDPRSYAAHVNDAPL